MPGNPAAASPGARSIQAAGPATDRPARLRTAPSRAVASARYAAAVLPGAGALALDGAAVIAGQAVAAADIGKLVFTSALNGNGTGYGDPTPETSPLLSR